MVEQRTQTPLMELNPPLRWNYEFRDPTADIERAFSNQVPIVSVHKKNLWGIQTLQEYEEIKRRRLKQDFRGRSTEEVRKILEEHPVHAVAIPLELSNNDLWDTIYGRHKYQLTVLDGHHRVRFSPKELREIPTMIFTIEQAFETYHRRYTGTIDGFVEQILAEQGEALRSFTGISERFLPAAVYVRQQPDGSYRASERLA